MLQKQSNATCSGKGGERYRNILFTPLTGANRCARRRGRTPPGPCIVVITRRRRKEGHTEATLELAAMVIAAHAEGPIDGQGLNKIAAATG